MSPNPGFSASADVLLFVEDPGAANYAAALPDALASLGKRAVSLATGAAVPYLRTRAPGARASAFETLAEGTTARALLASLRPRSIAVGTSKNPLSFGLDLVDAARESGIPVMGLVDGFANADFRFRGTGPDARSHAPEWLAVPDAPTADAYVALGWNSAKVRICGHPRWDEVRNAAARLDSMDRTALRRSLFPGWKPGRPILVFAAELSDGLDPRQYRRSPSYTLAGRGLAEGRTEIVLDEFLDGLAALGAGTTRSGKPYRVLRLHPKQAPDELAGYRSAFDQVSSKEAPLEILHAADAVAGMTSMLLQEGALLGRPTLAVVPREAEKAWLPTIAMGVTPAATTRAEVVEGLRKLLEGYRSGTARLFSGTEGEDCAGKIARLLAAVADGLSE